LEEVDGAEEKSEKWGNTQEKTQNSNSQKGVFRNSKKEGHQGIGRMGTFTPDSNPTRDLWEKRGPNYSALWRTRRGGSGIFAEKNRKQI